MIATKQELKKLKNKVSAEYLINVESKSVGLFKVGSAIPTKSPFKIIKKTIIRQTEEGDEHVPIYSVTENGNEILQLWWEYDYNSGKYINQIGEIHILSDEFKTVSGIGINSTIEEFAQVYSEATFDCAELCNCQKIGTNRTNYFVQFNLESESIIDWNKCGFDGSEGLKISDFKKGSKIESIRIF